MASWTQKDMEHKTAGIDYRDLFEFPGYRVGSDGTVWTCRPKNGRGPITGIWRLRKQKLSKHGYMLVNLALGNGLSKWCRVHRLVAKAFLPNPLHKPDVSHLDHNKRNNSVHNLAWATESENEKHGYDTGAKVAVRGEYVGTSKLSRIDVERIKVGLSSGESQASLSRRFGVSQSNISKINTNVSWNHVES